MVSMPLSSPADPPTMPQAVERAPRGREREEVTAAFLKRAQRAEDPDERQAAWEQVVVANLGVARSLAARHRDKGVPLEDLEQVAFTALVKAVQRYDAERQHDFLSFAVPTIRGELKRHFRDCGWTVRPPRRIQEIQLDVLSAQADLAREEGRPPTPERIAQELGEAPEDVSEALQVEGCFRPSSLDAPVGDGTATMGELLPDSEEHDRAAAEARVVLAPVVRELSERDRRILHLRFFEGRTQQEIGEELGVTQMQVSRLLARIMRDLHDGLTDESEPSPA